MAIVPMVGTGTAADPIRPMYTPLPGSEEAKRIIGFSYVVSDDGKSALVEFVARDADAFEGLLNEKRADVTTWMKHSSSRTEVVKEFRKMRKDFDASSFGARAR